MNGPSWSRLVVLVILFVAACTGDSDRSPALATAATSDDVQARVQAKARRAEDLIPRYVRGGGDADKIRGLMGKVDKFARAGDLANAEKALDEVLAVVDPAKPAETPKPPDPPRATAPASPTTKSRMAAKDVQFLSMTIHADKVYESSNARTFDILDRDVGEVVSRLGEVGDGTSRKLAFSHVMPPWLVEKPFPGKMEHVIREAFRVAVKRNVAFHLSIESHYFWDNRPDLWNWFDSRKPGYDPGNKSNVEWTDWAGSPVKARYIGWSDRVLAPHMCYNSPRIRAEITRIVSQVLGPVLRTEIAALEKSGKGSLFAGITVTSEPSLDNYESVEKVMPNVGRMMNRDRATKTRLGYCALTHAGYSKDNPPTDFGRALAEVNQAFGAFWAKQFVDAGIPAGRLYTHVAAGADLPGSPVLKFTNAPIWTAFNDFSRPGWTTYPDGPLHKDFQALYRELEKHGNPPWGSTEASHHGLEGSKVPPATYLSWHFDHGATLVVINREKQFMTTVWSDEAIAAYKRFLRGEALK